MSLGATKSLLQELESSLPERPFSIRFWDGSELRSTRPPRFRVEVRSPRAIGHVLRAPSQLGLARAYVSGDAEVDDLDALVELIDSWRPPPLSRRARSRLLLAATGAMGLTRPPSPPEAEYRRPRGRLHSIRRDRQAIRRHYDVSNDFYALFLDRSMTYSGAIFSRGARTLEEAQEAKLELICQKLRLEPGQRVLDIGCGWGSFAIHAAERHGVEVLGITISEAQVGLARQRVEERGLGERVRIQLTDYRELDEGGFDAVASIGMVEHVGAPRVDDYAARVMRALRPGGRFLAQGIAKLGRERHRPSAFSQRYVFPDGELLHLSRMLRAFELAGLESLHVEGFRDDYAETLGHWAARLDQNVDEAIRVAGRERVRIWRLYLRAARHGFQTGFESLFQMVSARPGAAGAGAGRGGAVHRPAQRSQPADRRPAVPAGNGAGRAGTVQ